MFRQGPLGQRVQSAVALVFGYLLVPAALVVFGQPGSDLSHLLRRQLCDGGGDFFNGTHETASTSSTSNQSQYHPLRPSTTPAGETQRPSRTLSRAGIGLLAFAQHPRQLVQQPVDLLVGPD